MNLSTLASSCKTDKGERPCNNWTAKFYTRAYERLFKPLQDEEITLLELGVAFGGSLKLWREYFKKAKVIGVDIKECLPIKGVEIIKGDCTDHDWLINTFDNQSFDIVIDDASHRFEDIVASFAFFYGRCNLYYFVENQLNAPGLLQWLDERGVKYKIEQKDLIIIPCMNQSL